MLREVHHTTTFECVAREWLTMKAWESVTKKRGLDMLRRVVSGKIGPLPIKQVTPLMQHKESSAPCPAHSAQSPRVLGFL